MKLTDKALIEFKKIWMEDHPGVEIDPDMLKQIATHLMESVQIILGAKNGKNKQGN